MFAAGDLVVYGGEGVCRVESIGPSGMDYDRIGRLYYHLAPLYRSGTVLTPVDTAVLMRPVMSREAALGIARDAVVSFIRETWPQWPEKLPETEI